MLSRSRRPFYHQYYCPLFLWQKYVKLVNPWCRGRPSRSMKSLGKGQDMRHPERWTFWTLTNPRLSSILIRFRILMRVLLRICFTLFFLMRSTLALREPDFRKTRVLPFQGWYVLDWHSVVLTRHYSLSFVILLWSEKAKCVTILFK